MAFRYSLGGNDSDEEREDYRHLDPTLLNRAKKKPDAAMLHQWGKEQAAFVLPLPILSCAVFPVGL